MAIYKFVAEWNILGDDVRQISLGFSADPSADEGEVETAFDTLWNTLRTLYTDNLTLAGYTWYEGPQRVENHWEWGPAFRVQNRNVPGNDPFTLVMTPPQIAVCVTFPQPITTRRHQGRIYLPNPSTARVLEDGRFATPGIVADAFKTFFDSCKADGWTPVIITSGAGLGGALAITSVRVDNVFDTQRRRKYEASTETQTRALAP